MAVNNPLTIRWYDVRIGKLTYSMTGSRNGTDGTADCSGSITQAIRDAGGVAYDYLYSTVTLAGYLAKNGYKRISVNQSWDAKEGDVVLMSWGADMSTSGGAGGHVGVMKNSVNFISVDYWTGGIPGTAVSEHNWDYYYSVNAPRYIEVWRLEGNDNTSVSPQKPNIPTPQKSNDVDYMRQYGYVQWNKKVFRVDDRSNYSGILQVVSRELSGIGAVPITDDLRHYNGVPMAGISWADGTPNSSTEGTTFTFDQDEMAIVDYDIASNGIAVLVAGFKVWVDATVARKA